MIVDQKESMYDMAWAVKGDSVDIEQGAGFGEVSTVTLHRCQVQLLASEMGLMQGDLNAWRRVEVLERRLRTLHDRISRLDDMISAAAGKGREDLETESMFSITTWELASAFCDELAPAAGADGNPAETRRQPIPNLTETQGFSGAQAPLSLEVSQ
jgi:hypothetical protein